MNQLFNSVICIMTDINLKSSTIEKSFDIIKGFVQKLIGPTADEVGFLFADNLKLWRLKNQIRNLEKVKRIVEAKNIDIRHVNLKVLVPYLDGVALEEDEKLQDMWANLIVNYIDSNQNLITHVFPDILRQLSSEDILMLERMIAIEWKKAAHHCEYSNSIGNLERIGLIKEKITSISDDDEEDDDSMALAVYLPTPFGVDFYKACQPKYE